MARCKGECKKQEYKVENMQVSIVMADASNPAGCASEDRVENSKEAIDACNRMKSELEEPVWLKECDNPDDCGCSLQDVDWGDPLDGTGSKAITVVGCKYTIICVYKISSRIRPGACADIEFESTAMGFVPDRNITVETGEIAHIDPEKLEQIKDILC